MMLAVSNCSSDQPVNPYNKSLTFMLVIRLYLGSKFGRLLVRKYGADDVYVTQITNKLTDIHLNIR